jgi:predicted ATPase
MAFPKSVIFDVETNPIEPVAYDDCEHVSLTRDFLRSPEQFLRHLMDEEE